MTVEQYLQKRKQWLASQPTPRSCCPSCLKPKTTCFCRDIRCFVPQIQFVILMHEAEAKRSIATGRMAHLCLANSLLFEGTDFTEHEGVNALLQNPSHHCVALYPGANALNLTLSSQQAPHRLFPEGKRLVVFLYDATWSQAKRMRRLSVNLLGLPTICFTPSTPSRFEVRKQPASYCYSTIEAIHYLLDRLEPQIKPLHDNLLEVFGKMVQTQLSFQTRSRAIRGFRPRTAV